MTYFLRIGQDDLDLIPAEYPRNLRMCACALLNFFRNCQHFEGWWPISLDKLRKHLLYQFGRDAISQAAEVLHKHGLVLRKHNRLNKRAWEYKFNVPKRPKPDTTGDSATVVERSATVAEDSTTVADYSTTIDIDRSGDRSKDHSLQERSESELINGEERTKPKPKLKVKSDVGINTPPPEKPKEELLQPEKDIHEGKCSEPPARDSEKYEAALRLLEDRIFLHWWEERVKKTEFGTTQLVMAPSAFVKQTIRNKPDAALDMFEAFQNEMSARVENVNLRQASGGIVSAEEQEAIATIAPYAHTQITTPALPAAPEAQPVSSAPEGGNADAYREYKPTQVEAAPMPSEVRSQLAKFKFGQKAQKPANQELEQLRKDLKHPLLQNKVIRTVFKSDCYEIEYDEQGNPVDVVEIPTRS